MKKPGSRKAASCPHGRSEVFGSSNRLGLPPGLVMVVNSPSDMASEMSPYHRENNDALDPYNQGLHGTGFGSSAVSMHHAHQDETEIYVNETLDYDFNFQYDYGVNAMHQQQSLIKQPTLDAGMDGDPEIYDPYCAQYLDNGMLDHCDNYDDVGLEGEDPYGVEQFSDSQYQDACAF